MKTFEDLYFAVLGNRICAKEFFNNGYGISVVREEFTYTSKDKLDFEIAILKGNKENYSLCYTTSITDDVIGYCSPKKVSEIMKEIQELPKIN